MSKNPLTNGAPIYSDSIFGNKYRVLAVIVLFMVITLYMDYIEPPVSSYHEATINEVIVSKNAKVLTVEKINGKVASLPTGSGNTIYKIVYTKDGNKYVALFRAINEDSVDRTPDSYANEESWIFYPDPVTD